MKPENSKMMEKRLDDNVSEKYIVGESITIADFDNAAFAYTNIYND
jgi:glutathione S-transferase